jgi:hypothetical protein
MSYAARFLLVLFLCPLPAVPASAGGPLQPPDGAGNPSGADYTGYSPRFFVTGIVDDPEQRTHVTCFNAGNATVSIAYQAYFTGADPSRPPVGDDVDPAAPTETVVVSNLSGDAPAIGVGRILVSDARTPVLCEARVVEAVSGDTIAVLSVVPIGKAPRVRIR